MRATTALHRITSSTRLLAWILLHILQEHHVKIASNDSSPQTQPTASATAGFTARRTPMQVKQGGTEVLEQHKKHTPHQRVVAK
jgi:hypothetical protein